MKTRNAEYGMRNEDRSDDDCGKIIAVMAPVLAVLFVLMERML